MKKYLFLPLLTSAFMFSSSASYAVTGTVKFTGEIYEASCALDGTVGPVKMGNYSKADIGAKSAVVGSRIGFEIKLKDCPVVAADKLALSIKLTGTADSDVPEIIKLDGSGATGVGIGIYDPKKSSLIKIDSTLHDLDTKIEHKQMTIPLQAAYVSNGATKAAGPANASVNFEIEYK
ncbi:Type-1A pilin [Yersinia aldovae]|uniref:fimbrial protein n=1 Tax=Yersinia aldovae TaxID=29483 RepID=UPI0005E303CA|nr:fimbrial protein [Yersinia aldovae]CNK02230.1 Type-1A pilin [Yersinia aldovae]